MSLPAELAEAVRAATGRSARGGTRVGGGDINDAWRVELDDGTPAFVKTRADAPAGEYAAEAAMLRWLGDADGGLPVPDVLGVADTEGKPRLLALAWLDEGRRGDETLLGRGLAALHAAGAPAFGAGPTGEDAPSRGHARSEADAPWEDDGPSEGDASPGVRRLRIGPLELADRPGDDWPAFYAEHRLRPLLRRAADGGALSASGVRAVEEVCERIGELAGPPEPPARLHGDLWSGNVLWSGGRPHLIDPVAYGGHREVDLAMLSLFGSPGRGFLAAYEDRAPLADGHEARIPLWQLFPLLVHAVLFGGSYGAAVERAARQALAA